jgi:actin-related protein
MNALDNVHHALVYDIGSATILAGHAGDYSCEILFPSAAPISDGDGAGTSRFSFDESQVYSQSHSHVLADIIDDAYSIADSNLLHDFLSFTHRQFAVDPSTFSVVYTQPAHLPGEHNRSWQSCLAELGFETFGHPSVCIASDAVLSSYAHCQQTALVVDFGWSFLRIVPVIEGRPRLQAIQSHPIGGYALSRILCERLQKRHIPLFRPSVDLSESQLLFHDRRVSVDIIESCCSYAGNTLPENFLYFLHDRPVDVQSEMKLLAAIHFTELGGEGDETVLPIPQLIKRAIDDCPDDAKRPLWSNIVTSGGFSQLNSFLAAVQNGARQIADPVFDVQVKYPMAERCGGKHTVWTGGSIFATSRVFPRFCVTPEEWKESGESVFPLKCF